MVGSSNDGLTDFKNFSGTLAILKSRTSRKARPQMIQLLKLFSNNSTEDHMIVRGGHSSWADGRGRGAGYNRNWKSSEEREESSDNIVLSSEARYLSSSDYLSHVWLDLAA